MASIDYDEISHAEITTFLNVAQTLNMSLTASKMNISQPAVSKRIASLETKYGLILFVRTNKGLQLTPAGKVFYREILRSQEHLYAAFQKAEQIQRSPQRVLHLNYDGFFDLPLLHRIILEFQEKYRNADVDIRFWTKEDCSDLFSGAADLMLCPESFAEGIGDYLSSIPVSAFPFCIIVSAEHPLAQREHVGLRDLAGIPLTVAHSNQDSPYLRKLNAMFLPHGIRPRIEHIASRDSLCIELLLRHGVTIASPVFWKRFRDKDKEYFLDQIRVYPIENESYPVSLYWRADDEDACLYDFVKCFREVIRRPENRQTVLESYS